MVRDRQIPGKVMQHARSDLKFFLERPVPLSAPVTSSNYPPSPWSCSPRRVMGQCTCAARWKVYGHAPEEDGKQEKHARGGEEQTPKRDGTL